MWCANLILISCLGVVYCRPQEHQPANVEYVDSSTNVEIEPQFIEKIASADIDQGFRPKVNPHRKIEASTKEILEKIAEVNKNQGLVQKNPKLNYFHFPLSYSRAQDNDDKLKNFKFSRDPFTNPVLEYLKNEETNTANKDTIPSFRRSNLNNADYPSNHFISITDPNAKIEPEDHIPGQYIKRKITHYQGFLMPNPYQLNMYNVAPSDLPLPPKQYPNQPAIIPSGAYPHNNLYQFPTQQLGMYPMPNIGAWDDTFQLEKNKNRTNLEKATVDNIKNIITGTSHNTQSSNFQPSLPIAYQNFLGANSQNPKHLNIQLQNMSYLGSFMPDSNMLTQNDQANQIQNVFSQNEFSKYFGPALRQPANARQNWNWPGANLFPIYVRDPFLQMYYAFTNMIEYGPNSGTDGPCKLTPRPQRTKIQVSSKTSSNIKEDGNQINYMINKKIGTDNINVFDLEDSKVDHVQYLDIEDIDIGGDELVKFTVNLPELNLSGGRELKDDTKFEKNRLDKFHQLHNNSALLQLTSGKLDFLSTPVRTESSLTNKQLMPIRDPVLQIEELEDEPLESEKAEDISISNQGLKKIFSRENTGNGIFIHKLKVRQGGVAIAGPGGIATAGSGGTAIVGPNGIAYTHPDGLAIAGSGTQVVAVDPKVDLNEAIKDSVMNGTRHIPNTRVGKVVAVGPVIYYNRG